VIHVSFTDQWQTLLDENGKPLIGRVKFFNADSKQYKSIYYDIQGETQGENPQYTLQDGRLEHQVFIASGVYTCRVEKFLGTDVSSMRDHANDDTYWQNYKSFKIYGGAEEVEGGSDIAAGFCDTIAALRLVDPSEHGVVSVIGYYSKEDGIEPRTYVWVEGNNDAEDYGSTIVSSVTSYTSAGRWKLCESPIVCATTFGVFPYGTSSASASDLSMKATALAAFANKSAICSKVAFESGRYYFASGTRLSFLKEVFTGCTTSSQRTIRFDMDGIQDLVEGETLDGTVEVSFLGGIDTPQTSPIIDNGDYITIAIGRGTIRTAWIKPSLVKHIEASCGFKNIHCILDDEGSGNFCNSDTTFESWTFEGMSTILRTIPQNCVFRKCAFIGKCFGNASNGCTFEYCGTIYQDQIFGTTINDTCIWNLDGSIKSNGTKFFCSRLFLTQNYTDYIDNNCIESYKDGVIVSFSSDTLKYLDRNFTLQGKIGFANSDRCYAKDYYSFDDCVMYAVIYGKKIDLCGESYSISLDVAEIGSAPVRFANGSVTIGKTGIKVYSNTIDLDKVNATFTEDLSPLTIIANDSNITGLRSDDSDNPYILYLNNCIIEKTSDYNTNVGNCNANNSTFKGSFDFRPTDSVLGQSFVGCSFNSRLRLNTSSTLTKCYVKVVGCTFRIANSGTPVEIIQLVTHGPYGSFGNDEENKYVIENNRFFGDAYLRPTKRVIVPIEEDDPDVVAKDIPMGELADNLFSIGLLQRFRVSGARCVDFVYNYGVPVRIGEDDNYIVNNDTKTYPYRFYAIVEKL
jgi:hypothetical protein